MHRALLALVALSFAFAAPDVATGQTPAAAQTYDEPFFPGATHDDAISPPDAVLGYRLGDHPATHAQILECVRTWAEQSDRVRLFEYATSHEGRELVYLAISSPENVQRLDEIKRDLARLADPRGLNDREADRLVDSVPAVGWFAYSIHGDELSGADAALAAAYHLAACTDDEVVRTLEEAVVLIDPLMNPDGRDRYLAQLREMRGNLPDYDDQSRLHGGRWPWGRTNHYLFDLNRDWILGVNPETRGRIEAAGAWHPLLFIDAHEMGAQDTYLFTPPSKPLNPHIPAFAKRWWDPFAEAQADAFDRFGWRYYTGEWADDWYPGYSNSWAAYRGAVGILYEQAGVDWFGVKRPENRVLTYRESVHHQLVSTMANLRTLVERADALKRDWLSARREAVSPEGPYAERLFAVVPDGNRARLRNFVDLMRLQGFELHETTEPLRAPATDRLGRRQDEREFPVGTILIPNRQPEAHLIAAMLDFDPRMTDEFLIEERRRLIKDGDSQIYDVTGWSLAMLHDVDAYTVAAALPGSARRFDGLEPSASGIDLRDARQGWVIDGADDRTPALAARLMDAGVRVRFADEAFTWGDNAFARGSLVVTRSDHRSAEPGWVEALDRACEAMGLRALAVDTGLGDGEVADIGGEHFPLLERPRIAVLGEHPVSSYDFGSIWHTLDERYRVGATYLSAERMGWTDLRRYNVLVLPEGAAEAIEDRADDLRRWVESGGTLIAIGSTATSMAHEDGLSGARLLRNVLEDLDAYDIAVRREWVSEVIFFDEMDRFWERDATAATPFYPWREEDLERPEPEELERRDAWSREFMPAGAVLAARADDEHWLTAGARAHVPVMFGGDEVLMAKGNVEAPVRFGVFDERGQGGRVGWSSAPAGQGLLLRMSGLLWPEAASRIANSAYLTREGVGEGQVILFASPPTFRASTLGTMRLFMNAAVYGPGLGASHPIQP